MTFTTLESTSSLCSNSNPETWCPAKPLTSLGFLSSKDLWTRRWQEQCCLPMSEAYPEIKATQSKQSQGEDEEDTTHENVASSSTCPELPLSFSVSKPQNDSLLHKLLWVKFLAGTERWLAHSVISTNSKKGFSQICILNHTWLSWKFSCSGARSFCFVLFNFGFRQGFVI